MYHYSKDELLSESREKYQNLLHERHLDPAERCFNLLYSICYKASESGGFSASEVMNIYQQVIFDKGE